MGVLPIIAARIAGIRQRLHCPFTAAFQHNASTALKAADLAASRRNERRPE